MSAPAADVHLQPAVICALASAHRAGLPVCALTRAAGRDANRGNGRQPLRDRCQGARRQGRRRPRHRRPLVHARPRPTTHSHTQPHTHAGCKLTAQQHAASCPCRRLSSLLGLCTGTLRRCARAAGPPAPTQPHTITHTTPQGPHQHLSSGRLAPARAATASTAPISRGGFWPAGVEAGYKILLQPRFFLSGPPFRCSHPLGREGPGAKPTNQRSGLAGMIEWVVRPIPLSFAPAPVRAPRGRAVQARRCRPRLSRRRVCCAPLSLSGGARLPAAAVVSRSLLLCLSHRQSAACASFRPT